MERATFFNRLRESRLLTDAELEQAAQRFRDEDPTQIIADVLVKEGVLTPFQARQMCDGDTQRLSLGQYRLLDELGRGGMGRVYKALHTIMGRVVAIKVIAPELVSDPVAVEWFHREVRASTQLVHPNIVMAFDANEADGLHFLVMEYVQGVTLDAWVKARGPLSVEHACALMRQAALGLQHAHEKGMVHRDIKPGNLLIPHPPAEQCPDVLVKILDFGLARLQGKTKGDTIALRGEAGLLGTPDYISPEQSRDIHAADIRSDLYSLGCAFYYALAGHVPFPGDNAMEKLVKHLTEEPAPLEQVQPNVPATLAAIVRRMMAKDPADRYQTPAEFVHALEAWATECPAPSSAPPTCDGPRWITPPTEAPVRLSNQTQSEEATRALQNVPVFLPPSRIIEPSGPSLLEPPWKFPPEQSRPRLTRDTMTLSQPEKNAQEQAPAPESAAAVASADDTLNEVGNAAPTATPEAVPPGSLPPVDPVVTRLWLRWSEMIESIVVGKGGVSKIDSRDYRTIHSLLLQACRAAVEEAQHPERRALYEEMLSIARPWMKLQAFPRTEAPMLNSLLERCQALRIEANNGSVPWTIREGIGLVLLLLGPVGMAVWYGKFGKVRLGQLLDSLDGTLSLASLHSAWKYLQGQPLLVVGAVFPLAILFSVLLLSRPSRV